MNYNTQEQNNINIARFNDQINETKSWGTWYLDNPHDEDIAYHENWGALMSVVQKINTIESYKFNLNIYACGCIITIPREDDKIIISTETTVDNQIKCVYDAVVKFVNYYQK